MLIATIATGATAAKEIKVLLHTINQWYGDKADVFILTDTPTAPAIRSIKSAARMYVRTSLDAYAGYTRKDMEARSGTKYASLFHHFTMEKATAIEWAFFEKPKEAQEQGVWFLDADVCLLSALPVVSSQTATLGVSPHYIRPVDEARYGRFNAGMIWVRDVALMDVWRKATYGSRFYEQAALEAVVASKPAEEVVEFPMQDNFGWWRFLQSTDAPPVIQSRLGFRRTADSVGLTYEDATLRSIHTHWGEATEFNRWIRSKLEILGRSHPPAKALLHVLSPFFKESGGGKN